MSNYDEKVKACAEEIDDNSSTRSAIERIIHQHFPAETRGEPRTPNGRTLADAIHETERLLDETFNSLNPDDDRDGWFTVRITKIREALADRPGASPYLSDPRGEDAVIMNWLEAHVELLTYHANGVTCTMSAYGPEKRNLRAAVRKAMSNSPAPAPSKSEAGIPSRQPDIGSTERMAGVPAEAPVEKSRLEVRQDHD